MRALNLLAMALAAVALAGCAMAPLPPPQASLANIQTLRGGGYAPMEVGDFTPAPGRPTEMDRRVQVRAMSQAAPEGSFAKYLGSTLRAELQGAGLLSKDSGLLVTGVVTNTYIDSAMPVGRGELAAKFTLSRRGVVVFDKTMSVDATWPSEFLGAVAIPDAYNHYLALYPALVTKLLADPDFRAAAKAP